MTNELVVAYGTSNLDLRAEPRYALVLQSTDTLAQAGLHQPTRLQIDRRIRVDVNDRRFIKNRLIGTARLGRLPESMTLELINCYAALPIVAEGDERVGFHQSRPDAAGVAAQHF